jgi:drug/metabolite transporter (DMT)-like permease
VTPKLITFISTSLLLQSGAFLLLKFASLINGKMEIVLFGIALTFMFTRAFVWQKILKLAPLSHVYPFTLLTQVLLFFYGVVFFNESYNKFHLIGLLIILLGLAIIFQEDKKDRCI